MKCIKEQKLWEYLDDEVSTIEKERIETHLQSCHKCQEHLEEINFFDAEFSETVINGLEQSIIDEVINENKVTEIELNREERILQLQKCWKKLALFGITVVAVTILLFVFACPISNYHVYEAGFHQFTYAISQFLVFMTTPILMSVWVIIVTFGVLFKIDQMWLNRYKQA